MTDMEALTTAATRAAIGLQRMVPLMDATVDYVLDEGNRMSRARFDYPGRVIDTEPIPLLAGDVD